MNAAYKRQLEQNIGRYSWYKVLCKRVYLPLIAIQLVSEGHVTIAQIAIIAAVGSITQLILQMPTGYLADHYGNRVAMITGTSIWAISPLVYIVMPNFTGGLVATILFMGGFAFQSGAVEAFMLDTLTAIGRANDYSQVMGRAQSFGLIGNVFLITLVPATYGIDHRLPFLLGFISLLVTVWLVANFTYPAATTSARHRKNPVAAIKLIVTAQNVALFVFVGVMSGVSNRGGEFRELFYQNVGISVAIFGVLLAVGSIAGAIMGRYIQVLDRLKPLDLYLVDFTFMAACLALTGLTRNPFLIISGFTLFSAYGRIRIIVFQAKLLHNLEHSYKATLISALDAFTIVGEVAAVALLAHLIGLTNFNTGYLYFALATLAIGAPLWLWIAAQTPPELKPAKQAATPTNQ